MDLWEKS
jgi:hypothetical protein